MICEPNCKLYCSEDISKIENYDLAMADENQVWLCHHRLETHNSDGERRLVDLTLKELKALGMYYKRPAEELIFLTKAEHQILHLKGKPNKGRLGKHLTEEHRKVLSEANRGKTPWNKGKSSWNKGKHPSEETRRKLSEAHKGGKSTTGMKWFNNGIINIVAFECPEGFVKGRLTRK